METLLDCIINDDIDQAIHLLSLGESPNSMFNRRSLLSHCVDYNRNVLFDILVQNGATLGFRNQINYDNLICRDWSEDQINLFVEAVHRNFPECHVNIECKPNVHTNSSESLISNLCYSIVHKEHIELKTRNEEIDNVIYGYTVYEDYTRYVFDTYGVPTSISVLLNPLKVASKDRKNEVIEVIVENMKKCQDLSEVNEAINILVKNGLRQYADLLKDPDQSIPIIEDETCLFDDIKKDDFKMIKELLKTNGNQILDEVVDIAIKNSSEKIVEIVINYITTTECNERIVSNAMKDKDVSIFLKNGSTFNFLIPELIKSSITRMKPFSKNILRAIIRNPGYKDIMKNCFTLNGVSVKILYEILLEENYFPDDIIYDLINCASEYGNYEIVKGTLRQDLFSNFKNKSLYNALNNGFPEIAKLILDYINYALQPILDDALLAASSVGYFWAVKILVEKLKANPKLPCYGDSTALEAALGHGHQAIAQYLINKKAVVTPYAIVEAMNCNYWSQFSQMVKKKPATFFRNSSYLIQEAISLGRVRMAELLLKEGCNASSSVENIFISPCPLEFVMMFMKHGLSPQEILLKYQPKSKSEALNSLRAIDYLLNLDVIYTVGCFNFIEKICIYDEMEDVTEKALSILIKLPGYDRWSTADMLSCGCFSAISYAKSIGISFKRAYLRKVDPEAAWILIEDGARISYQFDYKNQKNRNVCREFMFFGCDFSGKFRLKNEIFLLEENFFR